MKKLFVSMMAVAMSMFAMASGSITITMNGDNGDTDYQSTVVLVEDAARNATYEAGYDAECLSTTPYGVLGVMFYGFVESKKCEHIYTDNLNGIQFGFTSNVTESGYHLYISFSDDAMKAKGYVLYDFAASQAIPLDGTITDYAFTATAGRVTVENRFQIGHDITVTLNNYGLATFSSVNATAIPSGLKAYTAEFQSLDQYLLLTEITDYIPAQTGVILYGTANADYTMAVVAPVAALSNNDLLPASAWAGAAANVYVLSGNEMHEYTGTEMKANKAYLQLSPSAPAPRRIALQINDAQGINNVEATVKAEKFVKDGQILIRRGEEVYNLQGQIVK